MSKTWREVLVDESDERLIGRYAELARLSTSPRFHRPQRAILEDDAAVIREVLESRGMSFGEPVPSTGIGGRDDGQHGVQSDRAL